MRTVGFAALMAVICAFASSVPASADARGYGTDRAEAARAEKAWIARRFAKRRYDRQVRRYSRGTAVECERARHADPTGLYAGYPCWAQEALAPRGDDFSH